MDFEELFLWWLAIVLFIGGIRLGNRLMERRENNKK